MTIARETPMDAAHRLAAGALRDGFKFEALHAYTDRDANLLYWRIRAKHPATGKKWIRPMKLTARGYELHEPGRPANGKPLYRLHELALRPDDVVIVTEGEYKADQLAALGLLVTTSGAADSAGEADWQALAGRDVLIWPDNDASGRHYADAVWAALRPLGCKLKVIDVDLLGLPPKGDAVDWLASHPQAKAADVLALACEQDPGIAQGDDGAKFAGSAAAQADTHAQASDNPPNSCRYGGGRFELTQRGVLFTGTDHEGDPLTYARAWRATANGLEDLASLHNDGLLILDELSQCDPKEAGEAAYLLANGQGKARAHRNGTARASLRWRLLFLSAGEESLAALMARCGRKANAGQEVRLADFNADAGVGLGAFETLNGCARPAALSRALTDAATRHHGAVGMVWLRAIVNDRDKLADIITGGVRQLVAENTPPDAAGQVLRVAQRFGLVAMAGELATHYGVTGWVEGEATQAATRCFAAWLDSFGGAGNREDRILLAQVRGFFETHGASRFEDVGASIDQRVVNRAGFYRAGLDGTREFLVLPEAFKRDLCAGFDQKAATQCLLAQGWIVPGADGRPTQKPRLPGIGTARVSNHLHRAS